MEDETGHHEVNKTRLAHRLIHDGDLSAALVLATSLALGLALGFALPTRFQVQFPPWPVPLSPRMAPSQGVIYNKAGALAYRCCVTFTYHCEVVGAGCQLSKS